MAEFLANLEPCLIGLEACSSSHHWARKLGSFGHAVKLMSPRFVKPHEQAILSVHRARQGLVKARAPKQQIRYVAYFLSLVSLFPVAFNRLANAYLTFWKMPKMICQEQCADCWKD